MSSPGTARRMWALGEPFHALMYFADELRVAGEAAGLTGFWQTYSAFRAAPLGMVGPEVVTASFYNFAPSFVAGRVTSVWDEAMSPAKDRPDSAEVAEAAELARWPPTAGSSVVPVPARPHLAL
jgi:hypothetical protein